MREIQSFAYLIKSFAATHFGVETTIGVLIGREKCEKITSNFLHIAIYSP